MSNIDYEELIRSPLDELDSGNASGWGLWVVGLVAGLLTGLLLVFLVGGETDPEPALVTTTTELAVVVDVVTPDYPDGYIELAPGLGAKVSELIVDEETITMSVNTVVARGGDVFAPIWPVGGLWWLESGSGTMVESSRVVLGRFSPGVFSVEFPAAPFNGETQFAEASLVERWDQQQLTGSVEMPFLGEPFIAPEPVTITASQDVTLIVPALELGRFLGKVEWILVGPEDGGRVDLVAVLLDGEGVEVGRYDSFPNLLDPGDHGVSEIISSRSFRDAQEGAETVVLEYTVSVVEVTPVAVNFDLGAVPIGR